MHTTSGGPNEKTLLMTKKGCLLVEVSLNMENAKTGYTIPISQPFLV